MSDGRIDLKVCVNFRSVSKRHIIMMVYPKYYSDDKLNEKVALLSIDVIVSKPRSILYDLVIFI